MKTTTGSKPRRSRQFAAREYMPQQAPVKKNYTVKDAKNNARTILDSKGVNIEMDLTSTLVWHSDDTRITLAELNTITLQIVKDSLRDL